jgi:hypothetical protein
MISVMAEQLGFIDSVSWAGQWPDISWPPDTDYREQSQPRRC